MPLKTLFIISLLLFVVIRPVFSAQATVNIGILSPAGEKKSRQMWQPTIDYLAEKIPAYDFRFIPVNKARLSQAVAKQEVDFFLTNTGHYVELETLYGATRILTLKKTWEGQTYSQWGSTLVVRRDNTAISTLEDLKDKKIAAVYKGAFAGYQIALQMLLKQNILAPGETNRVIFTGFPHHSPLDAVFNKQVDAAIIPSGVLERRIAAKIYAPDTFRVINPQYYAHFPYQVSTPLYPYWPLAKTRHAAESLGAQIVTALLDIPPQHPALTAGKISGWTVPLNYSGVHELMRELRIGPYENYGLITLTQLGRQYWQWLLVISLLFMVGIGVILYIYRLNAQLKESRSNLEQKINDRTLDLADINRQLKQLVEDEELLGLLLQTSLRFIPLQEYLRLSLRLLTAKLNWLEKNTGCQFFFVAKDNKDQLYLQAADQPEDHAQPPPLSSFTRELCLKAAVERKTVFASSHPDQDHHLQPEYSPEHAMYCVPVENEECCLGVLLLTLFPQHRSSSHEHHFLKRAANVLSMGISRHHAEQEIEFHAYHDSLTDLPNRRLLQDRLHQEINLAKRKHYFGAVIYLDLDHFKHINDSLGHSTGDKLLLQVARRLLDNMREEDTIARIGGDEFVIVLPSLHESLEISANIAGDFADKIRELIAQTYLLDGHEYHTSASLGITLFPKDSDQVEDLLKQADSALYEAKRHGRNTFYFFQQSMQKLAMQRLSMEKDIRQALEKNHFELFFQPQFNRNHELSGAEALIRWQHPEKGFISPADFIPVAEESSLILPLGERVLKLAAKFLKVLQSQSLPASFCSLSINISPKQFKQESFVRQIQELTTAQQIDPSILTLELTEGVLVDNIDDVSQKMMELKAMQIKISIDDFGTGYSSMSYLKRLPLDELKIDQSFVRELPKDKSNAAISEAIISMAKHLGLTVVAEGVETAEQLDFLKRTACTHYQGYYFSRPISAQDFITRYIQNPPPKPGTF